MADPTRPDDAAAANDPAANDPVANDPGPPPADGTDDVDRDVAAARHARRRRPAPATPMWQVMHAWAPVAAGVLRATAGLVMFAASLLTLPTTMATPFLTGVSLVMLIGGVAATIKACRDDDRLRRFGRIFSNVVAVLAGVAVALAVAAGPGAYAPRLDARPAPPPDDGTVRFVP
jgi:hypothetical protein